MTRTGVLILLRHGESTTNKAGRFTGWEDAPLTRRGMREATEAGVLIARSGLRPDSAHTSVLRRTIHSADLALEAMDRCWLPVSRSWRLNERQYGALTGRRKARVRREAGADRYQVWRRSLTGAPAPLGAARLARLRADPRYSGLGSAVPAVETLRDVARRVTPYWVDVLAPLLVAGRTPLVVAHGNTVRALITVLGRLGESEVEELNVPTAAPLCYRFDSALRPVERCGDYLDPERAQQAAHAVALEGGNPPPS